MRTELSVHRPVSVAQQRVVERILEFEFLLQIHRICADSDSLGTEFFELVRQVTEMTAFLRSKGRLRLRIEEEHHGAAFEQVIERDRRTLLVDRSEVLDVITCVHRGDAIARSPIGRDRTSTSIRAE